MPVLFVNAVLDANIKDVIVRDVLDSYFTIGNRMSRKSLFGIMSAVVALSHLGLNAVEAGGSNQPKIVTRLVWQDDDTKILRTADLLESDKLQLGPVTTVTGFPQLDVKRQTLVQMEAAHGMVLLGVRDDDDGKYQSGWVLVDSGVEEEIHGDHSHWHYPKLPSVRASVLNDKQGNPAHLYCYDKSFFVANDKLNGFTWLNPQSLTPADRADAVCRKAVFHQGGGGHITLASVQGKVAFSTWIDREGDNKGRVDRVLLSASGNTQIAQTIHLPSGGIHGATANAGKVFFAPTDGICWMDATSTATTPQIHHISLGKEGEKPRRTGGFTTFEKHVAFVTGSGESATLCFLNATSTSPQVSQLALKFAQGNRPTGLEFVKHRHGSPLAFVFQDHAADLEGPYRLTIVAVDPNLDGNWQDAKILQELDVGKAKVEGHGGHHCVAFDADRRRAIFTNPGDGTIAVMSLIDLKIVGQFAVGGCPSKLVALGGRNNGH